MTLLDLGWEAWCALGVVVTTFLILVFTTHSADCVFLGGLAVLLLTGVLDSKEALLGFSSTSVVTVGILYVVVSGLQETGGLLWVSKNVLGFPRSIRAAQFRLMLPVSFMSSFLNNTPIVALFIPVVMEWSRRIRVQPSHLLIPLSYASLLGGICTLIGTSTNLVVYGLVQNRYPEINISMFEITKLGVPCAVIGILFVITFNKLLPERKAFGEALENTREYTIEMQVEHTSSLIGKTIESGGLRHLPGAFVAEIIRDNHILPAVRPNEVIQENDRLVFVGNVDSVCTLYDQKGLKPALNQLFKLDAPRHRRCLVEVVVSNTCPLIGLSIREGRFREKYNAVVIAVARNGERVSGKIGDIVIKPGDTLLVESHAGFIPRQKDSRDFYLISAVDGAIPKRFELAPIAFTILVIMMVCASCEWLSMLEASTLAAFGMLLTGCCSVTQARRNIEWNVLLTIASALGLGLALEKTGVAKVLAEAMLSMTGSHPLGTLVMVYIVTSIFTELITNNAAAALIFPIAMNAAERLNVSVMPFIICVMVGASASFATPIGYQTNLMVYGPGGYKFSDYLRIGLPLHFIMIVVVTTLAPIIWPL